MYGPKYGSETTFGDKNHDFGRFAGSERPLVHFEHQRTRPETIPGSRNRFWVVLSRFEPFFTFFHIDDVWSKYGSGTTFGGKNRNFRRFAILTSKSGLGPLSRSYIVDVKKIIKMA